MAMQYAWIPGPEDYKILDNSPGQPPSTARTYATLSNHITGNMHCVHILQPEMVRVMATLTNGNQYTVIFFQDEHTNSLIFEDLKGPSIYPATVLTKLQNILRGNFPEAYERFIRTGRFLPYKYVFARHPPHQRIRD